MIKNISLDISTTINIKHEIITMLLNLANSRGMRTKITKNNDLYCYKISGQTTCTYCLSLLDGKIKIKEEKFLSCLPGSCGNISESIEYFDLMDPRCFEEAIYHLEKRVLLDDL